MFLFGSVKMSVMEYDVIILGSGPAGLTAAIYTSRAFLKTLVVSGDMPGGQLTQTTEIENFPGFVQGIQGVELMDNMRKQAERFNTVFAEGSIKELSGSSEEGFTLKTATNTYTGKSVIVATGASANWLGLESETKLRGKGVSACATCDAFFFKNKVVAIVGGGDASMEEAIFLTKFSPKVYVIVRGSKETMKASKFMQQKAFANDKLKFLFNTQIVEVLGTEKVSGLKLLNNVDSSESTLNDVEGLFVAIGHSPNTAFLKGFIDLDAKNYAVVSDNTKSSKEGVFVAGDVADHRYRQAVTAAGAGCMASLDVEKYLASK